MAHFARGFRSVPRPDTTYTPPRTPTWSLWITGAEVIGDAVLGLAAIAVAT
jgi:hypothetical protein